MAETTGAHPAKLWPGVKKWFGVKYAEKPLVCTQVFDEYSSDKAYEEYIEETGFGYAAVKAEGAGLSYDASQQGYTVRLRNVTYALGAKVSMEKIMDNLYEAEGKKKSGMLARSMRVTKEAVFANILNRAFNSSYTGGDGKELCATDHPSLSGSQANELAVAADFSEASLEDALTAIRGLTDSRGIRIQAKGMTLILPAALEFEAKRVLNSTLRSGTANNDINAVNGMLPNGPVIWDYLTDPDAWFIKTDVDEGLIRQERMAVKMDQDNDFDTKNACMSAVERYAAGWGDWRGLYGSAGA